jgi:hypothetical protein
MDIRAMSHDARFEAGMSRQNVLLESSPLLSNSQRAALSGPNKEAADAIRAIFPALARAAMYPYLVSNEGGGDSTSNLPDNYASQFPLQLQRFLPEEQRSRLVRTTISFTCSLP